MTKKIDFSKFGFVLKKLFLDRKAKARQGNDREKKEPERPTREEIQEMLNQWAARIQGAQGAERARLEEEYREEVERLKKEREKAGRGRLKRAGGWAVDKKRDLDDWGRGKKDFFRGKWKGEEARSKGGWMFILMAVLLYLIDMLVIRFNGINIQRFLDNLAFTSIESYIGWFFNSIVLTLLIAYYVLYRPDAKEFISWFLVVETLSLIIFLGGMGTVLIHLTFVIAFYFFYIRYSSPDKTTANYIFFFLLAFDFFGYGLLAEFVGNPIISNRLIIPIWFYFALIYTWEQERSFWINLLIFLVILINVFYFVGGIDGLRNMMAGLTPEEIQEGWNFWRTGINNVKTVWNNIITGFREGLEQQLEYATGGYYKGKVEKNKIGPLGVFIDKLQTSQPRYYPAEKVIIWGTVKALSLDEGVNIKINCHKKGKEVDVDKVTVIPNKTFTMYGLETRDFECSLKPGYLGTGFLSDFGIHTVTVDAEFNFGTLAYLKSYFMDLERKRGMVREGLDPFKEFGIKDTSPIAVYTDGPVIIGMETTSPIIEVSEETITRPRIGVTLENKEGWEGVIRSLSELILLIPPGVEISQPDKDCGDETPFKHYYFDKCEEEAFCCYDKNNQGYDGKGSCEKFVFKPCVDVCVERKITTDKYKNDRKGAEDKCKEECKSNYENCKDDCRILFQGEGEELSYKGYALDTTQLKVIDRFKDIDRFRSFSCRLNVEQDVLGNTPITVKYFRAKARYDYTLGKDIDVEIQTIPGTEESGKIDVSGFFIPQKIVDIARELDVDGKYALGVAAVESRFKHCCASSSATEDINCVGTEDEYCGDAGASNCRLIAGEYDNKKISFGAMQLNKRWHCAWFSPADICEDGRSKDGVSYTNHGCVGTYKVNYANTDCEIYEDANCGGENANYLDCNIRLGLAYLKYLYDKHGTKTKVYSCNGKSYTGWELALRYYNGITGECIENVNYVEDVKKKIKDMESGKLSALIGEKFEKDIISEQAYIEKELQPPLYLKVGELCSFGTCTLTWVASPSTEVQYYYVYREKGEDKKLLGIVAAGESEHTYEDAPTENGDYYYYVSSVSMVYDYSIESEPLKSDLITVTRIEGAP